MGREARARRARGACARSVWVCFLFFWGGGGCGYVIWGGTDVGMCWRGVCVGLITQGSVAHAPDLFCVLDVCVLWEGGCGYAFSGGTGKHQHQHQHHTAPSSFLTSTSERVGE
jgi:hypothetical protein